LWVNVFNELKVLGFRQRLLNQFSGVINRLSFFMPYFPLFWQCLWRLDYLFRLSVGGAGGTKDFAVVSEIHDFFFFGGIYDQIHHGDVKQSGRLAFDG
jgi:hypothetical protein